MLSSTPTSITPSIIEFGASLCSSSDPVFVPVGEPVQQEPGYCFYDVKAKISEAGGEMICGWTIWECPNIFLEAERHAVWRSAIGSLVDVTIKADGEKQILFLPDPMMIYDFERPNLIENKMWPLSDRFEVQTFIQAIRQKHKFIRQNSYSVGRTWVTRLDGKRSGQLARIESRMNSALAEIKLSSKG